MNFTHVILDSSYEKLNLSLVVPSLLPKKVKLGVYDVLEGNRVNGGEGTNCTLKIQRKNIVTSKIECQMKS